MIRLRALLRRLRWYSPAFSLIVCVGTLVVLAALSLSADVNRWMVDKPFIGTVLIEFLMATLFASAGYYWLLGRRGNQALKKYLSEVVLQPHHFAGEGASLAPTRLITVNLDVCEDVVAKVTAPDSDLPLLVVGPGGTGKTTMATMLLPQLVHADRLPVPLSVQGLAELDIPELVRHRFVSIISSSLKSDDDADAIWRRLQRMGRIVALIDGLDEFAPELLPSQRDIVIERAMYLARESDIAIVAMSRPTAVPRNLEARVIKLDSLSRPAAVEYLEGKLDGQLPTSVATLVHDDLPSSCLTPFYLNLIADLCRIEDLTDLPVDFEVVGELGLLDRYTDALTTGRLSVSSGLPTQQRKAALQQLIWVAAAMLLQTELECAIDDLGRALAGMGLDSIPEMQLRYAIDAGCALGILDTTGTDQRVRFRHSILHAYFASRAFREQPTLWRRVAEATVGTESLMAITMFGASRLTSDASQSKDVPQELPSEVLALGARRDDPDERLRLASAAADLALINGDRAIYAAVAHVATDVQQVARRNEKLAITRRLKQMSDPVAVRALWQYARDEDFVVRWEAAKALTSLGTTAQHVLFSDFEAGLTKGESYPRLALPGDGALDVAVLGWLLPAIQEHLPESKPETHRTQFERLMRLAVEWVDPLNLEISLSRGFKIAAILEPTAPVNPNAIALLETPAQYWHSRICLLHAIAIRIAHAEGDCPEMEYIRRAANDPHPFVQEAARLMLRGIINKEPWRRYVWENEVLESSGSVEESRNDETARLVGEVAVYSNLIYTARAVLPRGQEASFNYRSWIERVDLPRCISGSRDRSEVFVGCEDKCVFHLCTLANPQSGAARRIYDPTDAARSDFSESFCRLQRRVVRKCGPAPWHKGTSLRSLLNFWEHMEATSSRKLLLESMVNADLPVAS